MSGNKPKEDDIEHEWHGDAPYSFAEPKKGYLSPPKRKLKLRAEALPTNEDGDSIDPAVSRKPLLKPYKRNRVEDDEEITGKRDEDETDNELGEEAERYSSEDDEASLAAGKGTHGDQSIGSENRFEDEVGDSETSLIRENSPASEHEKAHFPASLATELGFANGQSDDEGEYTDTANEHIIPVDVSRSTLSISSRDSASEGGTNSVEVTNENILPLDVSQSTLSIPSHDSACEDGSMPVKAINTERSSHGLEPNMQELLQERDFLRKELAFYQPRTTLLRGENESLEKKLKLCNERLATVSRESDFQKEELESHIKRIAVLEAENKTLKNTTVKVHPTADASTNTDAPTEQVKQARYPREGDNEHHFTVIKYPSSPLPVSSFAMKMSAILQLIQTFFEMMKTLNLAFASKIGMRSPSGQDSFFSILRNPATLKKILHFFQNWVRATTIFLATPFWMAMSFSVYQSVQKEKNMWMQANALTRKQLLGHVGGASGEWNWDMIFAVGSLAVYSNYL